MVGDEIGVQSGSGPRGEITSVGDGPGVFEIVGLVVGSSVLVGVLPSVGVVSGVVIIWV